MGTVTFIAMHDGETLYLVGSMNNWDNKCIEMTKNLDGIFTITIDALKSGVHKYQFLPSSGSWDGQFKDPLNTIGKGDK